jgi:hypothetical protein
MDINFMSTPARTGEGRLACGTTLRHAVLSKFQNSKTNGSHPRRRVVADSVLEEFAVMAIGESGARTYYSDG